MKIDLLLKFRPAEPVVYPSLAGKMGLIDPRALGELVHFYYQLDAVRRDIDRWQGAPYGL